MPRKKREEHVNLERWLVSYADFITLLFALFVILYASSKIDQKKYRNVGKSITKAFSSDPMSTFDDVLPSSGVSPLPLDPTLEQLSGDLKRAFEDKIEVTTDHRGVVAKLAVNDFYEIGSAELKLEALPLLDQMAKSLKGMKNEIRVEGHTDNSKVTSAYYPSNWELSTSRATWIVRYFITRAGLDPKNLMAAGFAEHRPLEDNSTEEGRAKNRRVEIIVLREAAK